MAKILFSLSGEGRGHATRVRALIEELRDRHTVAIFAPRDAYTLLAPLYAGTEVKVRPLEGLLFHYTKRRRLDYFATFWQTSRYLARYPRLREELKEVLRVEKPDLVVTDFEPALPRAARAMGIPFVSVTHQHFMVTYDLGSLPRWLRFHATYMSWVVRAYYTGQCHTVVSSFYFPPLRAGCHDVTQVGVMLRPAIRRAVPTSGGHLIAYVRRFAGPHVLEALSQAKRPVRVYGLGEQPAQRNLTFHEVREDSFVQDLATADALVSTAGNQLVGEALYLGKPCLVLPEAGNYEQYINAYFLEQSGGGTWVELEKFRGPDLKDFLNRMDNFQLRMDRGQLDGLPATLRVLEAWLARDRREEGRPRDLEIA